MQVVKRIGILVGFVWLGLVLFLPKEEIYFALEKVLQEEGIEINETKIDPGFFTLTVHDAVIYVHGIEVATVQTMTCFTVLFFSRFEMKGVRAGKNFQAYFPKKADTVILTHRIWEPEEIGVEGRGSFGDFHGDIFLQEQKLHLDFTSEKHLGVLKNMLKKGSKGWYYETTF